VNTLVAQEFLPVPPEESVTRLLKVLHIGVSNRGEWPLRHCNASTGFVPAALCDVSEAALAGARAKTGLPESACFTDADRAIRESKVDCVIVCAPTVHHVPLAKKAIDAGLPVLIEKGMAPDFASAQHLAEHARSKRAIACVAQNYRYNPIERTICRAINDPSSPAYVGEVHQISCSQQRVRPDPRTLTYPFASVWDMSCHHFDNLQYWLGAPALSMTAHSWRADWSKYPHDSNTFAHIVYANAARTAVHYLHTHDAARASLEVQVHGSRGALVWRQREIDFSLRPTEQFGSRPIEPVSLETTGGEADLLRDFHRYITEGVEPGISVRNNLEIMAACEMMVRSIMHRRTVERDELSA
jgi:predicted dehydrogenase